MPRKASPAVAPMAGRESREGKGKERPTAPGGRFLQAQFMGGFAVAVGGCPVEALPRKAQALLAYLAMHRGRVISRDQLAGLLWSRSPGEQARRSLRQCLMSLRSALGAMASEVLTADAESMMLAK